MEDLPIEMKTINQNSQACINHKEEEEDDKCFMLQDAESDNDDQQDTISHQSDDITEHQTTNSYVGKKPKWWKKIARRKGTKAQRNAISEMTKRGYVIPRLDLYQHMIDIQQLLQILPRGAPLTNEILIPKENDHQDDKYISSVKPDKIIHLEIGFGQGENLLTNAITRPDDFYIGADIHQSGVGVALNRMKRGLDTGVYWDEQNWFGEKLNFIIGKDDNVQRDMKPYDNLRIYAGDGVKILRFLPPSSVDNIYLTFPDPWPKRNQSQYRVIQEEVVKLIGYVLKPGGHFYLATDSTIFDEWTCTIFDIIQKQSMKKEGYTMWTKLDDCPDRIHWLPVLSKYEMKGVEEGRYTICRCWKLTR